MPVPPPVGDLEKRLVGLLAILDHAVKEVHRVIADVSPGEPGAGEQPANKERDSDE